MLSIIIPTYNRISVLKMTLHALFESVSASRNGEFEVIVINDGSSDGTMTYLKKLKKDRGFLIVLSQSHKGPASARNVGIRNAHGEIVLFLGDDTVPSPPLISEHMKWHNVYPSEEIAVLGNMPWHPDISITPYMKWLVTGGPYFPFYRFRHDTFVESFISSNISVKRAFIGTERFDENFPYAIHEDTEFGWRLKRKGLRIVYNENAIAYHYHQVSLDDAFNRALHGGESKEYFKIKHPDHFSDKKPLMFFAKNLVHHILCSEIIFALVLKPLACLLEKREFTNILQNIQGAIFTETYRYYYWKGEKSTSTRNLESN